MQKLDLGFSIADGGYPTLMASPGSLSVAFRTSSGADASLAFSGVAAFTWQEGEVQVELDEPWDGACELTQSLLLASHPAGATMHGSTSLRHFRFRFHPWATLDVVCCSYVAAT